MTWGENYREYRTADKVSWGEGPWCDEPDKVQWIDAATGLDCLIVRNGGGALCGYVGVSEGHPCHGLGYAEESALLAEALERRKERPVGENPGMGVMLAMLSGTVKASPEIVFEVHGGLTFAAPCADSADESQHICHVPAPGRPAHVWWFGFDCAHAGDVRPADNALYPPFDDDASYRTIAYVKGEVEALARQLKAVA